MVITILPTLAVYGVSMVIVVLSLSVGHVSYLVKPYYVGMFVN